MLFDFSATGQPLRYKLMSQSVVPRPIAWIITEGESLNIAPFSFFSGVSSNPPTLMVAVGHKSDGTPKDTLHNIRTAKKCTICSVLPEALEKMHFSSAELGSELNEAELYDIETVITLEDYPPMIKGAPTAFFCTLLHEVALEGSKTVPLFLRIDHMYLDDWVECDESYRFELELLGRTGKGYMEPSPTIKPPRIPK